MDDIRDENGKKRRKKQIKKVWIRGTFTIIQALKDTADKERKGAKTELNREKSLKQTQTQRKSENEDCRLLSDRIENEEMNRTKKKNDSQ